jgi:purine-binding chemotaxis protein CheW
VTAIVIFRFGGVRCALEREAVAEIAPIPELARPPGMPASVAGFFNWRGEAVAVVDAANLFCVTADSETDPLYRHIIVVEDGSDRIGLLVDRVEDVRQIDDGAMVEPSGDTLNGCVIGKIAIADADVHVLAPGRILLVAEKARIADLRLAEQARLDAMAAS